MTPTVPVFIWRKAYEVNVPRIDDQHRKLVALLSELHEAMQEGQGQAVLRKVLDSLTGYTVWHFRTEERLMAEDCYPGYDQHREEHRLFVRQVKCFIRNLEAGKTTMTVKVLQFLRHWLFEHIQNSDRRFAAYLLSRR